MGEHEARKLTPEDRDRLEAEKLRRADMDVLREIMATPQGRGWLWRRLEACHIFGNTFFGEETHRSAFAQGQENVGRRLWADVQEASLELYVKMCAEQKAETERQRREREEAEKIARSMEDGFFAVNEEARPIDLPAPE